MGEEATVQKEKSASLPEEGNGYVDPIITPDWIKANYGDIYVDDKFKSLIVFYVVNTPAKYSSCRSIGLETGDDKQSDHSDDDKNISLNQIDIAQSPFVALENLSDMKTACTNLFLEDDFYNNRDPERIVTFRSEKNGERYESIESIFYHIRNSFAHGRFIIYNDKENSTFVMEDETKSRGNIVVSARMVLKQSTLVKWMEILQSGKYPEDINIKLTKSSNQKKNTKGADK